MCTHSVLSSSSGLESPYMSSTKGLGVSSNSAYTIWSRSDQKMDVWPLPARLTRIALSLPPSSIWQIRPWEHRRNVCYERDDITSIRGVEIRGECIDCMRFDLVYQKEYTSGQLICPHKHPSSHNQASHLLLYPIKTNFIHPVDPPQVAPDGVTHVFCATAFDLVAKLEIMKVFHSLIISSARFGDSIKETKAQPD